MKVLIFAKPGAKRTACSELENLVLGFDACLSIAVKEPARDGAANHAVEAALAGHFRVPVSRVRIISGLTGRKKIAVVEQ